MNAQAAQAGHAAQRADAVAATKPGRGATSAQVVLAYLGTHAARLQALAPQVQRGAPGSVHQMRVTARRLRGTLGSFPMVLPREATGRLREDLKWLEAVLGEARDLEVTGRRLEAGLSGYPPELVLGPARARIRAHFAPREAAAREAISAALAAPRFAALVDELHAFLARPPAGGRAAAPAGDVLPAAVARAWRRTRRRMRRAERTRSAMARDAALHEARKAARRARYAAEALEPVYGKSARRFVRKMKAVQSALGGHQDAVIARAAAREIGIRAHLAGESAFSFGLLCEREHQRCLKSRERARRAWRHARHRKARRWLS
jgi:CHAD domain-containing protein